MYQETKKEQRKAVLKKRDEMPPELRQEKSRRICSRIANSEYYHAAHTIMVFKAFRSEADLTALEEKAKADGKTIVYPYCIEDCRMLGLIPQSEDAWDTDRYGIRVPIRARSITAEPENIDLVICPCSGFDDRLNRLGMGAGYYDRFLPLCRNAVITAAAFEEQRIDRVITDDRDIRMNAVFTDEKTYLPEGETV